MAQPPAFRIVLVGHDWVQKNKVGNLLLGRPVFETSTKKPAKNYNTGFTGYVVDRYITVFNTAELFVSDPSDYDLKQRVKECVSLCAPGPHAFVLVVNPADFDKPKGQKMEFIVKSFSENAFQHSIVFIYKEQKKENRELENIITLCGGKNHQYKNNEINEKNQMGALKAIEEMVSRNEGSFVNCDLYAEEKEMTEMYTNLPSRPENRDREAVNVTSSSSNVGHISSERLNLVLCGSNTAAKASAADLILGLGDQTEPSPQPSSACVKREAEVCGRQVTLVLLPSLGDTQLSEEALLQEIPQCLRLCDPGVHAFLLVNPQGPLTDEYKVELTRFKHFFGEEVEAYCERVLTGESDGDEGAVPQEVKEKSYHILDRKSKVLPLLEKVKKMSEKDAGCYTSEMYISGQLKIHLKCHSQLEEMKMMIQTLNGSTQGNTDGLRIVLLGKTGAGKSATGNTILGADVFKVVPSTKSVTTECRKETAIINRRRITVVDTPGLFDTACDQEETKKEIIRCIAMAAPGPHVFLLVVAIGRFTAEERDAVEMIQSMFGEESGKYTVVLFTRGDDLTGTTLDKYLEDADQGVKSLLRNCGNRHHLFNNKDKSSDQVPKLLDKIDAMLKANEGKYFTTEMFQKAEEALKQEQERILKDREEEIKKEKEELQAKHEAEMEKLKREMEEERRTQEEERRRRAEESKCMEKDLKKAIKDLEEEERRKRTEMDENYKAQKQRNEDWIKQRTEVILQERQRQQEEWAIKTQAEQRRLEEEEKQRNIKYVEKQRQEEEKFNLEKDKMMKEAREEKRKKQQEYEERVKKEEERRKDLEENIKYAETSRVKDLEEQKRKHDEECQKKREEEDTRRKEEIKEWTGIIQLREKQWSDQQALQRQEKERIEREQQEEKKRRDAKEEQRKQEQEDERKKIEQDAQKQIKEKEDEMRQLELQLQEEERKSRDREEQQKEEMDKQLRRQKEQFEAEKQKQAKASEEKERRDVEYLKVVHEKEKDYLKRETEMAARMQAEKEFNEQLDRKVKEAKTQGHKEGHKEGKEEGFQEGWEEVESKRTKPGRKVDEVINGLYALVQHMQDSGNRGANSSPFSEIRLQVICERKLS